MKKSVTNKLRQLSTNLNLKRIIGLVLEVAKAWTIAAVGMILLETCLFFGSLYMLKLLVDAVAGADFSDTAEQQQVIYYVILSAVLAIAYNIAKAVSAYITEIQAARVAEHIDDKIHESAIALPLAFYESPSYFDILKRARDAGSERPNLVIITLIEVLKNLFSLAAIASILITINWLLLPILIVFILPTFFVRIFFSDKLNALRMKHTPTERKAAYLSNLITSDTSAKEIRSYQLGEYLKNQYLAIRLKLLAERLRISFSRSKSEMFATALASAGFFACIAYITMKAISGQTTVGDITLFLFIFPQTFNFLQNITAGISLIYHNTIFVNSIFELIDLRPVTDGDAHSEPLPVDTPFHISFQNVSFTYPHADKPSLHDVSLKIPEGKIVAVIGLNGAGKTTLIKLLCRLYDPTAGHILLNGSDIRQYSEEDYRRQISVVFQDFSKYNVSARDNIRFGDIRRSDYSQHDIEQAAVNAGAHDYICRFPEQYDTMMGRIFEDGHEVSIGQWQKLATARALFSSSRLVILDEATSALDTVAEAALFDSLRKHIGKRSALVISHRHSTIRQADYIYVLSEGRISQEGTDRQLLAEEGDYARLFRQKAEINNI